MKLPTLYKKTSNGKIEQWTIRVEIPEDQTVQDGDDLHCLIITEHGLMGGKLQESVESVHEGKNLGKANATNSREQAESQAQSEWNTKKTRKGYTEDLEKAKGGANDGAGGIRPMLAKSFSKDGDKVTFPCQAQPKLDGIRCISVVGADGNVTLWSREQKPITAVPHIAEAVKALDLGPGTVLDGELYNHDFKADFEKIVSAVRKQGPVDAATAGVIQYHVYDLPRNPEGMAQSYDERHTSLVKIFGFKKPGACLKLVETVRCEEKDDLLAYFEDCRARGYEGCMARNVDGPYEDGRRSPHLQKLKEFDEAEFIIVNVEEGVGKMEGLAIFVCTTMPASLMAVNTDDFEKSLFRCKMEGSLEGLRKYVENPKLAIGKMLTVKYQGLTGKAKVPRFPVGKAVRDYE